MPDADPAKQFRRRVEQHVSVTRALLDDRYVSFAIDVAEVLSRAIERGGKVLVCGNGGSAADASHLATEFVGRFMIDRRPFAALSLCDNSSALTAIANDLEFSDIFARQVRALGRSGDVLLALSTSGASANVLAAVGAAREGSADDRLHRSLRHRPRPVSRPLSAGACRRHRTDPRGIHARRSHHLRARRTGSGAVASEASLPSTRGS